MFHVKHFEYIIFCSRDRISFSFLIGSRQTFCLCSFVELCSPRHAQFANLSIPKSNSKMIMLSLFTYWGVNLSELFHVKHFALKIFTVFWSFFVFSMLFLCVFLYNRSNEYRNCFT